MLELEQTLDSREVAGMVEKEHKYLMRDIRNYTRILTGAKISPVDFFREGTYKDSKGEERLCYRITKKGCEFIGHKIRGEKGVLFTARYINRFHEMQDILSKKEVEPELPWFIRRFKGKYIMLFRDFKSLTGVEISGNYTSYKRLDRLQGGLDYNGWAWYTTVNKEDFLKEHGFEYGDDDCMMYFYPCGIRKALEIYRQESGRKINQETYDMISDALKSIVKIEKPAKANLQTTKKESVSTQPFIQIQVFGNSDYLISTK